MVCLESDTCQSSQLLNTSFKRGFFSNLYPMIKRTAVERCPLFSVETGFYLKAPGILFVIERKKKQMNHETIQKLQFTTIQFLKKFKHVRLASIVKNGWRKWSLQHV
ncbi:DNA mismatch repair protein mutS [Enterococcus faecalis CBRD01]|nr:DNA mismatch repair protein mutS [Enterococcus faecalis CBRD01]